MLERDRDGSRGATSTRPGSVAIISGIPVATILGTDKALGWDVTNKEGNAPQYRDVIFEDSIKVASGTQAPDYCFTLSGARKFFVEAKKPSVDVQNDQDAVYQLRRYAWTAKLPLSILTNFDSLAVYESRRRPRPEDKASTERIKLLRYEEFVENWNEVAGIFSRKAVRQGSFDKFAETKERKQGTQQVGDAFLNELEKWREDIARNVALRNPALSIHDLNYSVQRTVDRIVFLRMCEDRGIERYGQLQDLLKTDHTYEGLCQLYRRSDEKYNSGLFHFDMERGRNTPPDEITLGLGIDDSVLKGIIKDLYYPDCPYEFSVLPPEILGNIYERFLGKVIRLTEGHRAKVEEKPEVKKAGGVYYTPKYIVDYIVTNTVGKLCEGKSPKAISELRILDPACGSGSFLLGAYAYLLRYHLDYYTKQGKSEKFKDQVYQGRGGAWYLTIKEKKRILLNNIYGVDIDPQAVEVTKLSLLLKVLEGESKDVFERQQKLFRERALPDLDNNIKCGNSLLDYRQVGQVLLDEDTRRRVNPFDWKTEFPGVFSDGGFDAVIGNPPYVRVQTMKEWAPLEVELYKTQYKAASKGNYDIYVCFVERSLSLLGPQGRLGFILPNKFFQAQYGAALREEITGGRLLQHIVNFRDQQVFDGPTTYTCLLFLDRTGSIRVRYAETYKLTGLGQELQSTSDKDEYQDENIGVGWMPQLTHGSSPWNLSVGGKKAEILSRLQSRWPTLKDVTIRVFSGGQTSADHIFILDLIEKTSSGAKVRSQKDGREHVLETDCLRSLVKGGDMKRYFLRPSTRVLLFPYEFKDGRASLLDEKTFELKYPRCWAYLLENKPSLVGRKGTTAWYAYGFPKNLSEFDKPKIVTPYLSMSAAYSYDSTGGYYFPIGAAGGYGIQPREDLDPRYLLALLNSRLLDSLLKHMSTMFHGGWYSYQHQFLNPLPIRTVNLTKATDKALYERVLAHVDRLTALAPQLDQMPHSQERDLALREYRALNEEIDKLVYELYGLTPEDIKDVEEDHNARRESRSLH